MIGIRENIPTNEYTGLIKNINDQTVDTFPNTESDDNGVSLLQILTEVSQNEADIRKLQNQVSDTDFNEQKQKLSQLENRLSEPTNSVAGK